MRRPNFKKLFQWFFFLVFQIVSVVYASTEEESIFDLTFEELGNIAVSIASLYPESIVSAPAIT